MSSLHAAHVPDAQRARRRAGAAAHALGALVPARAADARPRSAARLDGAGRRAPSGSAASATDCRNADGRPRASLARRRTASVTPDRRRQACRRNSCAPRRAQLRSCTSRASARRCVRISSTRRPGMNAWEESGTTSRRYRQGSRTGRSRSARRTPAPELRDEPRANATFADVPATALSSRNHRAWQHGKSLEDHVYRNVIAERSCRCPASR